MNALRSLARPLLRPASAPAPCPSSTRGRYNLRAITRAAHAEARAGQARHAALGLKPWSYSLHLKHALHVVWGDARVHAHCAREDARLAAMSPEVASLIRERATALHIDSLPVMTRELAAIDSRAAALGMRP